MFSRALRRSGSHDLSEIVCTQTVNFLKLYNASKKVLCHHTKFCIKGSKLYECFSRVFFVKLKFIQFVICILKVSQYECFSRGFL